MYCGCLINGCILVVLLILMISYISYLPYIPFEQNASIGFHEIDRDISIEVLNSKTGAINLEGWARYPNKFLYNSDMNYSKLLSTFKRLNAWNYYYFIADKYLVTMALSDNSYIQAAYFNVRNIVDSSQDTIEATAEIIWPKTLFLDRNKNRQNVYSSVTHKNLNLTIFNRPGSEFGVINVEANTNKGKLEGNFTIDFSNAEGITGIKSALNRNKQYLKDNSLLSSNVTQDYIHKEDEESDYYFYGTKTPLLRFIGDLSLNQNRILKCSNIAPCLGLNDNGNSYFPYINSWIWASACFRAKSVNSDEHFNVAFSIGHSRFDPGSQLDAVFVNGKLYKIDPLSLLKIDNSSFEWMNSNKSSEYSKNSLKLKFQKDSFHQIKANYLVAAVDFKSYFGKFSGELTTEDGNHIKFEDVFGFIEDFHARF